ncbi:hypothetical protein TYRP_004136 [Tyrophagus putrescentiae]|nr:hypothetical protein TYRP_004136 [Tyrophagus putrescentiae]
MAIVARRAYTSVKVMLLGGRGGPLPASADDAAFRPSLLLAGGGSASPSGSVVLKRVFRRSGRLSGVHRLSVEHGINGKTVTELGCCWLQCR